MISSPPQPGAMETAVEDLKGHIAQTSGETVQGFWLLTEWVCGCLKENGNMWFHWDRKGDSRVIETPLGFVQVISCPFQLEICFSLASWVDGFDSIFLDWHSHPTTASTARVHVTAFKDKWSSFLGAQLWSLHSSMLSVTTLDILGTGEKSTKGPDAV